MASVIDANFAIVISRRATLVKLDPSQVSCTREIDAQILMFLIKSVSRRVSKDFTRLDSSANLEHRSTIQHSKGKFLIKSLHLDKFIYVYTLLYMYTHARNRYHSFICLARIEIPSSSTPPAARFLVNSRRFSRSIIESSFANDNRPVRPCLRRTSNSMDNTDR